MNSYVKSYLEHKKLQKLFSLDENDFIKNSLDLHSFIYNDCDVIPICSTDIFSEAILFSNKSYILFDINFILYMQHIFNNIIFLNYFIENNLHAEKQQQILNIKSDAFHFLTLYYYRNPKFSLYFAERSKELFKPLNIHREPDQDTLLFFQIINLYIIRHENTHNNYTSKKFSDLKLLLQRKLRLIIDVKSKDNKTHDQKLHKLCEENIKDIDNSILTRGC